ncbi:MAG: D-alanyl-D-alanine carboxypeptidase [Actinomycetota bacterium]|nr:D-alanyl-D-alanine carboxypeptidase [Actinomycetota bacterium]
MRRVFTGLLATSILLAAPTAASARELWKQRLDELTAGKAIGVAVREEGRFLYRRTSAQRRIPASNQKLLLSMALFDTLEPTKTIETTAATAGLIGSVVDGDLWILGRGDPTITAGAAYGRQLPFTPTRLRALALAITSAGITRVEGSVVGNTGYFEHDWDAPGWKHDFASEYIPLPSALTFEGNVRRGDHISNPEHRAAAALTRKLENLGVEVTGDPGSGQAPAGLIDVASVSSQPLTTMVRYMNRGSSNFFAEVFGKRLGLERFGVPGTIAKGAAAIAGWAERQEVPLVAHDSSGLSYENKVSPGALVRLLGIAEDRTWGETLRRSLPTGGQGTLEDRLTDVRVRAKTGTLENISALSGYVWLRQRDTWAEFSILSRGMSKAFASAVEDDIVRTLTRYGR